MTPHLPILANVIWVYYLPYFILTGFFPLVAVATVLLEAWLMGRGLRAWKKCLWISLLANLSSWLLGWLFVAASRGIVLPDRPPATYFDLQHLLAAFGVAYLLSAGIELFFWKAAFRRLSWKRMGERVFFANFVSYGLTLGVSMILRLMSY